MLRKSIFALASVFALGTAAGCGDDGNGGGNGGGPDVGEQTCAENPDQDKCQVSDNARDTPVYSYLSGLQLPAEDPEDKEKVTCCVDYNGDGVLDNGLVGILGLVGGFLGGDDLDLDEVLGGLFEDGSFSLLFEHVNLDEDVAAGGGAFSVNIHLGDTESNWADRSSNKGVFTLGEKIVSVDAFLRRGVISANVPNLPLSLDLSTFSDDIVDTIGVSEITLPLSGVQLEIQALEATGDDGAGIYSADGLTDRTGKPTNFLSAYLKGADVADLANDILGGMCGSPLLVFEDEPSDGVPGNEDDFADPVLDLHPDFDAAAWEAHENDICGTVAGFGEMVGVLGTIFDLDTNDNYTYDSLSLGLHIAFSGATVETVE